MCVCERAYFAQRATRVRATIDETSINGVTKLLAVSRYLCELLQLLVFPFTVRSCLSVYHEDRHSMHHCPPGGGCGEGGVVGYSSEPDTVRRGTVPRHTEVCTQVSLSGHERGAYATPPTLCCAALPSTHWTTPLPLSHPARLRISSH